MPLEPATAIAHHVAGFIAKKIYEAQTGKKLTPSLPNGTTNTGGNGMSDIGNAKQKANAAQGAASGVDAALQDAATKLEEAIGLITDAAEDSDRPEPETIIQSWQQGLENIQAAQQQVAQGNEAIDGLGPQW